MSKLAVKKISTVQRFECPICNSLHASQKLAENCLEKCEKHEQKKKLNDARQKNWQKHMDSIRMEAESITDVERLLVKYAKKYMGLDLKVKIDVRFTTVSTSHGTPIGFKMPEVKNWCYPTLLGWRGSIKGSVNGKSRQDGQKYADLHDIVGNGWGDTGFRGLHTGTGCPGSEFDIEFYMFLDDFPKLKKLHEEATTLLKKENEYNVQLLQQNKKVSQEAVNRIGSDPAFAPLVHDIDTVNIEIAKLREKLHELTAKKSKLENTHLHEVEKLKDKLFPIPKSYSYDKEKLDTLKKLFNFSSY